jgi:hypothetical protein
MLIAAAALIAFSPAESFVAAKTKTQCADQSADAVVSCSTMSGPREARCIRNSTAQYKGLHGLGIGQQEKHASGRASTRPGSASTRDVKNFNRLG